MVARMTTIAFLLVIASAFTHATWNFLLKRSQHKIAFFWSLGAVSFVAFLLPAAVFAYVDGIGVRGVMFGVVSGLIHGVYGLSLSRGYELGDLSAVYPISRGMGPALVPIGAVIFLDERASAVAGFGIFLVVVGVFVVNIEARTFRDLVQPLRAFNRPATRVALLTGALIASYSLWDKTALDHLSPVTLILFVMAGNMLILAPVALRNNAASVLTEWRERRESILAAGLLAPLGYVLVLVALTTSRVSYVAPAREMGIVVGAFLGVLLLGEGYGAWRVFGALLILAGVLTLGLAP
jgi:drug/metabolite transporter (DMT)-like permease